MKHRERITHLVLGLILVLSLALSACQPSPPAETEMPEGEKEPLDVAFVLPGVINDGSFTSQAYNGILDAEEQLGIEYTYVESVAVPDAPKVIRDYASEGHDVVWAHSGAFVNATLQVAPDFPDTTFVTLAGPSVEAPDNVWIVGNEFEDAFFLAGALAGMMTETNTLGFIGGIEIPIYAASAQAYEAGGKYTNSDVQALSTFTGDFNDPTAAKQAASGQIENGADIIGHALNLGAFGLFEAARAEEGVYVIGKDIDQQPLAPDVVLTSVVLDFGEMMLRVLERIQDGEKGGYLPINLEQGTAYLAPFYGQVPSDIETRLNEIREELIAGEIDYPTQADLQ